MIALTSRLSDANRRFQRNRLSLEKIRTRAGRWSSSLAFPSPAHRMNVTHPTKTHPLPLLSSVPAGGGGVEVSQFIREGLPCLDNPNHRLSYLRRSEKDLIVGGTAVLCLLQVQRWHWSNHVHFRNWRFSQRYWLRFTSSAVLRHVKGWTLYQLLGWSKFLRLGDTAIQEEKNEFSLRCFTFKMTELRPFEKCVHIYRSTRYHITRE